MNDEQLSIEQAAAYLGMTVRNLRKHIYVIRDIKPDGLFGNKVLQFNRSTLDKYLAQTSEKHADNLVKKA